MADEIIARVLRQIVMGRRKIHAPPQVTQYPKAIHELRTTSLSLATTIPSI